MENKFKAKFEYCHILNDNIVITKTPEIDDLVVDFAKSINDFFKTLMVFFIFIPIFTALSVVMYYNGNYGIAIYAGGFALLFLSIAFYSILFTSGNPVIPKEKIVKIKFKKTFLINSIEIKYMEFGRIKKRGIVLSNNQIDIDAALMILIENGLIETKNIEVNSRKIDTYSNILTIILTVVAMTLFFAGKDFLQRTFKSDSIVSNGILMIIISMTIISIIIRKLMSSFFYSKNKTTNR